MQTVYHTEFNHIFIHKLSGYLLGLCHIFVAFVFIFVLISHTQVKSSSLKVEHFQHMWGQ